MPVDISVDSLVKLENIIQSTTVFKIISIIYSPVIASITTARVFVCECGKTSSIKIIVRIGEIKLRTLRTKITTDECLIS
ncbi:hypothetical protein FACS1894126_1500 [Alphaproteobacteria bacterium]|nr:hypothetical protein FACS1894126_1500 [Alphaproteobacteria bacterium]